MICLLFLTRDHFRRLLFVERGNANCTELAVGCKLPDHCETHFLKYLQ